MSAAVKERLIGVAGRPYGHVPGHRFLDVELLQRGRRWVIRVTHGSAQGRGHDAEHGRAEYARATLDAARDAAFELETDEETRRLIELACAGRAK